MSPQADRQHWVAGLENTQFSMRYWQTEREAVSLGKWIKKSVRHINRCICVLKCQVFQTNPSLSPADCNACLVFTWAEHPQVLSTKCGDPYTTTTTILYRHYYTRPLIHFTNQNQEIDLNIILHFKGECHNVDVKQWLSSLSRRVRGSASFILQHLGQTLLLPRGAPHPLQTL